MKHKCKACRIEGKGNHWSIFDLKTGKEFFKAEFVGGETRLQFAFLGCMATLYDELTLGCRLSGEALTQTFVELSVVVKSPVPVLFMGFKGIQNGCETEIELKEDCQHAKV